MTKLRSDNQRLSAGALGVVSFLDHLSWSSDIVLVSLGDIVSLSLQLVHALKLHNLHNNARAYVVCWPVFFVA